MKNEYPTKNAAFTLIERLTAVAVIDILGAILLPALSGERKNADATKTGSNLRQIGVAVKLYANENNWRFPHEYFPDSDRYRLIMTNRTIPGLNGTTNWREAVHRYITDTYTPRSGYNYALGADKEVWTAGNADKVSNHFGVNLFMLYDNQSRLNRIPDPAKYVIIGEINSPSHFIDPRVDPDYSGEVNSGYRISHPNDSAFYLFADGHVEQLEGRRPVDQYTEMWRHN